MPGGGARRVRRTPGGRGHRPKRVRPVPWSWVGCVGGEAAARELAFEEWVRRFQDMAFAMAFARLGHVQGGQDVAQDPFVVAGLHLPQLNDPAAFPGWFRHRSVAGRSPSASAASAGAAPGDGGYSVAEPTRPNARGCRSKPARTSVPAPTAARTGCRPCSGGTPRRPPCWAAGGSRRATSGPLRAWGRWSICGRCSGPTVASRRRRAAAALLPAAHRLSRLDAVRRSARGGGRGLRLRLPQRSVGRHGLPAGTRRGHRRPLPRYRPDLGGRAEAVRWLFDHGVDVNRRAAFAGPTHGEGGTALHLAAQAGHLDVVLVGRGADLHPRDALHGGGARGRRGGARRPRGRGGARLPGATDVRRAPWVCPAGDARRIA